MISVQGHRGARGALPENTLPAFHHAIEAGADFLELDVAVTRDNVLIIAHDPFLNPALHRWKDGRDIVPEQPFHAFNAAELRGLDCGSLAAPGFPLQRPVPGAVLPALADLFVYVREMRHPNAARVRFNIELKSVPAGDGLTQPPPREFAKLVLDLLRKSGFKGRIIVQSFDHRVLVELRKLEPRLPLAALFSDNAVDYALLAKKLRVQAVSANMYWLERADVLALHKAKLRVYVWTANAERDWERLTALKVDSIITDYPAELLGFLRARKLHK